MAESAKSAADQSGKKLAEHRERRHHLTEVSRLKDRMRFLASFSVVSLSVSCATAANIISALVSELTAA